MKKQTEIRKIYTGQELTKSESDELASVAAMDSDFLNDVGIEIDPAFVSNIPSQAGIAMDAGLVEPITDPSSGIPQQFAQAWLKGIVYAMQRKRAATKMANEVQAGSFEDDVIIQECMEFTGDVEAFSEFGSPPLSSYNTTYQTRDVVRVYGGTNTTLLNDLRAARAGTNANDSNRRSLVNTFAIAKDEIQMRGYGEGGLRVYGLLNDPLLPAPVASSDTFSNLTSDAIVSELQGMIARVKTRSGGNYNPEETPGTLSMPTSAHTAMTTSDDSRFALSPKQWLQENYPLIKIVMVPKLDGADAGDDIMYLSADLVPESGTDDLAAGILPVLTDLRAISSLPNKHGGQTESYAATYGGYINKRAYAVERLTGV